MQMQSNAMIIVIIKTKTVISKPYLIGKSRSSINSTRNFQSVLKSLGWGIILMTFTHECLINAQRYRDYISYERLQYDKLHGLTEDF